MGTILLILFASVAGYLFADAVETQGAFSLPYTENMHLGYFYDVDKLAQGIDSPFTPNGRASWVTISHESSSFLYKTVDSAKEQRDLLDIKGSLSLKIKALNGIDINASGKYLTEKSSSSKFVEILAVIRFMKETRTLTRQTEKTSGFTELVKTAASNNYYHYIRSVTYGGEFIASLKFTSTETKDVQDIQAEASLDVRATAVDVSVAGKFQLLAEQLSKTSNVEVKVYITGGRGSRELISTVEQLNTAMDNFIQDMNDPSLLAPIRVSLVPVSQLIPNDVVTQGIQFIIDRALEAASARFDEYLDDLIQAKLIFKEIEELTITNPEDEKKAEDLYAMVAGLENVFARAVQQFSFNRRSATVNAELMENAIEQYNAKEGGNLPRKFVRASNTLRDKLKGVTVEGQVPSLLRAELLTYAKLMVDSVAAHPALKKINCAKKKRLDSKEVTSSKDVDLLVPGFAMHLYSPAETIPANTAIDFGPIEDDYDYIESYFNTEMVVPSTTSVKDYYRSKIMSDKRTLSKILRRKKSHKVHKRLTHRDESTGNKVALFQTPNVVAPLNGVYLLSYQLYNTGDVTEVVLPEPCSTGWILFQDRCYQAVRQAVNYQSAKQGCAARGAEIVMVKNAEEQTFVHSLIANARQWLSMQLIGNSWKWRDGTAAQFFKWSSWEPNNWQGIEDCAEMYSNGYWNDIYCTRQNYYSCVKDKRKRIESKGLVQVRVKKGEEILSNHRSRSETPEDVAGSKCDVPSDILPISKPIIAKLAEGNQVHVEQTVGVPRMEEKDNYYSGVLLSAVTVST